MAVVPATRIGKIEFYEVHVEAWQADPAAIGLDPAQVAVLAERTDEARAAYLRAQEALNAARAAVLDYHLRVRTLHAAPGGGADLIRTIRNFAEMTDDPEVYTRALLPGPRPRSTAPPPGTPRSLRADLLPAGGLRLTWKCDNPRGTQGTLYEIRRSDAPSIGAASGDGGDYDAAGGGGDARGGSAAHPLVYLDTVGEKRFIDPRPPATRGGVIYQITALRSTRRGKPARFGVNIGANFGAAG